MPCIRLVIHVTRGVRSGPSPAVEAGTRTAILTQPRTDRVEAGGFVALTTAVIYDWRSFHRESQRALGFPADYAGDMNAWVDCLVSLRDEGERRVGVRLATDEMLQLELADVEGLRERVPGILETIVDACAEVNRRFLEVGQVPAVTLIFV